MGNGDLNHSGLVKFVEEREDRADATKMALRRLNHASSHSDSFRKMAGKRKRLNSSCRFLAFIPHVYGYPGESERPPVHLFRKAE